jgi:mannose-6-phosphate isomerase-like protein (cupin superfamily)
MRNTLLTYTAPGAGRHVLIGSFGTTYKVLSEASRGALAVVEHTLGPGRLGAPLHRHSKEDEVSYVLEGTLTVQQGSRIERGGPGTCIHKPRGVYHAFWNSGSPREASSTISRNSSCWRPGPRPRTLPASPPWATGSASSSTLPPCPTCCIGIA